jgi:phospholipid transport system substrate-binding protein
MSRYVLGQNWKKANAQQQAAFVKEFRTLLVRTYSTSLKKSIAAGKTFDVNYLPSAGSKERPKIKTLVKETGKAPTAVDYDMYFTKGSWKAYNVTVEGVSLVTNYQNEFDKDIRTIGMDSLINKIRNQNQNSQN